MLQLVEIFLFILYAHRALWHVIQQYTIGFVAGLWYLHLFLWCISQWCSIQKFIQYPANEVCGPFSSVSRDIWLMNVPVPPSRNKMHDFRRGLTTDAFIREISGWRPSLIARFMGPTWGPSGAERTQVGHMLAPWTLLSGLLIQVKVCKMTILGELIVLFVSYSRGLFK